jgi:hypothetical protein
VAGFKSEWWPDLFRNGGRLQIGIPAGFKSVHPAGLNRNPHPGSAPMPKLLGLHALPPAPATANGAAS